MTDRTAANRRYYLKHLDYFRSYTSKTSNKRRIYRNLHKAKAIKASLQWQKDNVEKYKKHYREYNWKRSGMRLSSGGFFTEKDYQILFKEQKGLCAICKRSHELFKMRLAVDHDHKTGLVRGLLCSYCNRWRVSKNTAESAKLVYEYFKQVEAK